jgi:hypothetical protein
MTTQFTPTTVIIEQADIDKLGEKIQEFVAIAGQAQIPYPLLIGILHNTIYNLQQDNYQQTQRAYINLMSAGETNGLAN